MEPTLFAGDIVLVRKADGFWQRWKTSSGNRTVGGEGKQQKEMPIIKDKFTIERERVLAYERKHCNSNGSIGLLRKPPTPITNNLVVFKDPKKYPDRWNVKRVVALGGQIKMNSQPSHLDTSNRDDHKKLSIDRGVWSSDNNEAQLDITTYVPPYCIWVEGDNPRNSIDSRSEGHGPVSKKLLVGIAEYRLWPPWRMGKLDNENKPNDSRPSE